MWGLVPSRSLFHLTRRGFASLNAGRSPSSSMNVFNREHKRIQRNQAAKLEDFKNCNYIRDEIASRIVDRLHDITRRFPVTLDLGSGTGSVIKFVTQEKMDTLIQMDMSENMLENASNENQEVSTLNVVGDEEFLPFQENSFDAVLSSLSLHWVNDLPGTLAQVRRTLKPDSPLIAAMFGGDTLYELRTSLQVAQQEREGGIAPHISPFTDIRDLGGLLQRAGFSLITVDVDSVVVNYPSVFHLLEDLGTMGEGHATHDRPTFLKRDTLLAAAATYKDVYQNADGTIPATFQIYYMIGWKPSPSQPQPKERGSATVSLKDLEKGLLPPKPK